MIVTINNIDYDTNTTTDIILTNTNFTENTKRIKIFYKFNIYKS